MKKYLFILCIIFLFTGCSNSNNESSDYMSKENRTVYISNIGLKLVRPKNWIENIMITQTLPTDEGEIFSEVDFLYCNNENLDIITAPDFTENSDDYTNNIFKILVVYDENIELEKVKTEIANFKQNKTLKQNNGLSYIALWENNSLDNIGDNYISDYNSKLDNIDDLLNSVEITDFDIEKTISDTKRRENLLSFNTTDIDGNEVNSSIFADYDITMVNFWGTYVLSDNINETEVLEQVNSRISAMNDANFFQVVIDLPSEENEKLLRETRQNATYLCLIPDINLATFATSNLEGVPTTIFVDRDGAIVGEQIKGTQTVNEYMTILLEELDKIKNAN